MKDRRTLAERDREPAATTRVGAQPVVRFRDAGRRHAEAALAEVAPTIRRFRLLLTMMIVCIPLSMVGGLVLLWRLGS